MKIIGIVFCLLGLLHGGIKYFVIRDAARDLYNGGGAPVMDFVIVVPLWWALGTWLLLEHGHLYPFPFFGLVQYVVLATVFYGIMQREYRLGKPEISRQLAELKKRREAGAMGGQASRE